jgi:hypothetical protein
MVALFFPSLYFTNFSSMKRSRIQFAYPKISTSQPYKCKHQITPNLPDAQSTTVAHLINPDA